MSLVGSCSRCGDVDSLRYDPSDPETDRPTICDSCKARLEEDFRDVDSDYRSGADSEIVYTAGISSVVLEGDSAVGHTLLLDADSSDAIAVHNAAASMDGISAVFESSPGSYHIWDLSVRDLEEQLLESLSWSLADPQHIQQSRLRGYYVLRATSKVREDGSRYKSSPELLDVYTPELEELGDQSLPHYRRLLETLREQESESLLERLPSPEDVPTVGDPDGLSVDRYMTLTDSAKESLGE